MQAQPIEPSWEDLAAGALAGEAVARRDLARRVIARVRRFAVLMGARGPDLEATVLSILQEAFGSLATARSESSFVAWLDRIAMQRLVSGGSEWSTGDDASSADPGLSHGDPRGRAALERAVRSLGALEPERRFALILAIAGACCEEDLAAVLEIAPVAARARVERARREVERAEHEVDATFEDTVAHGDDAWIDALTERRMERTAIATLEGAPASAPVPAARPRRWAWAGRGAAAAAAAGLAIAAALWPAGPKAPRPRLDAVVALSSGEAAVGGERATAGRWVGAGASFEVPAEGRLALALGDGTLLHLSAGAKGTVDAWTIENARVTLTEGTAVARIARRRARTFTLRTADLEVRAGGATVAVTAGARSTLRVLRGQAEAVYRAGRSRTVMEAHELLGAGASPTPLDRGRAAADWALLGPRTVAAHGARVQIETTPPGALVEIGGEAVGRTPLSLIARPATEQVAITLAEHAPVREEIVLRAGTLVQRKFTLPPLGADEPR